MSYSLTSTTSSSAFDADDVTQRCVRCLRQNSTELKVHNGRRCLTSASKSSKTYLKLEHNHFMNTSNTQGGICGLNSKPVGEVRMKLPRIEAPKVPRWWGADSGCPLHAGEGYVPSPQPLPRICLII